jgi:hypothetical protein
MTGPDFCTFIDSLIPGHQAWLSVNLIPMGRQFFDHCVARSPLPAGSVLLPIKPLWNYFSNRFHSPSETTSTSPSITLMAV